MPDPADSSQPRHICLTPTRNESWIINRFVKAAQYWASNIIIVDQQSTDDTLAHLRSNGSVDVLVNESTVYDEAYRQRLLIERARTISGKRIFFALDADEALSANCLGSSEWLKISQAQPGTVLRFRWVNILPGFKEAWIPSNLIACGFVDDGSPHEGNRIHSRRVPWPQGAPVLDLEEIVVLHFQYVAWSRVVSKQRWYQAWEHVNNPKKSALDIFRQYNHMHGSWNRGEIHPIDPKWFEGYEKTNVEFRTLVSEPVTWWDREMLKMLTEHGPDRFRRIAVWDKNWDAFATQVGLSTSKASDPRTLSEKLIHYLLSASQKHRANWLVRAFEHMLRRWGW